MKKVCRNCNKEYSVCVSCLPNRPYLRKYCSIFCKEQYEKKINKGSEGK